MRSCQADDRECLALAEEADRALMRHDRVGPLHGLPWAFKDLEAVVGFPFTNGSPIYQSNMPTEDTLLVERILVAGAIPIGKTNVPEFGMGSHTYNRVYGITRNPYDTAKSAGGSSGGAAAAVAAGLLPLADGGDLGDRCATPPASTTWSDLSERWSGANRPTMLPFLGFGVKGPIARSVGDGLSHERDSGTRSPRSGRVSLRSVNVCSRARA
jgi:amidase